MNQLCNCSMKIRIWRLKGDFSSKLQVQSEKKVNTYWSFVYSLFHFVLIFAIQVYVFIRYSICNVYVLAEICCSVSDLMFLFHLKCFCFVFTYYVSIVFVIMFTRLFLHLDSRFPVNTYPAASQQYLLKFVEING